MPRLLVAIAFGAGLGALGCAGAAAEPPRSAAAVAEPGVAPEVPVKPATATPVEPERAWADIQIDPVDVTFQSGPNVLHGVLVKPPGDGPFPTMLWNHGSEEKPQLPRRLAKFWVGQGWAFFSPFRRGHATSGGVYYGVARQGVASSERAAFEVAELERQVDDVVAAATYLRTQRFVDPERMVVSGGSFGGIETMLTAERGAGFKAALDFAGAAMSWEHNDKLRDRLRLAAQRAKIPVFYIQAANDFSIEPTQVLSKEAERSGRPHQAKIYPPNGDDHMAGHTLCVTRPDVWGPDVLAFLKPLVR